MSKVGEITQKRNFELIKAMHTVVIYMNNEDAIEPWFFAYPDGADDEELMDMAGDSELMDDLAGNFRRRMAQGMDDGWITSPLWEWEPESIRVYGCRERMAYDD